MTDLAHSTTTTTKTNGPKLRTACDLCQLSKVRCSRGKPSCWRCSQNGVKCVYSPLRKTGRLPKNSDNNAAAQREYAVSRCTLNTNSSQDCSSRNIVIQEASSDCRLPHHPQPQDAITARTVPKPCPPVRLQQPLAKLAASSAAPGGATLAVHSMNHTVSQDPSQNLEPSTTNLHVDDGATDFSALHMDLDMDMDMDMWALPTMSDLAMDYGEGDIEPTNLIGSEKDEIGNLALPSALSSPSTTLDTHEPRSCTYRAPSKQPTALLNGLCARSIAMSVSGMSAEVTETGLASPPQSAPVIDSSSYHTPSPSGTHTVSKGSGMQEHASNRMCSQDGCYKALSGLLTKLGDLDLSQSDGMQLDGLLCIDRELQHKVRMALNCGHCMKMPSNQNLLMIIYMSLDSLLSLFENQEKQHEEKPASTNGYYNHSLSMAMAAVSAAATAVPRQHPIVHSQRLPFRVTRDRSGDTRTQSPHHFPWTEQSLVVGTFLVDDVVKASFLQRVCLDYIDDVLSILAELDRMADTILKCVNCMITKQKAEDIFRRAYFLRARLLLATDESSTL